MQIIRTVQSEANILKCQAFGAKPHLCNVWVEYKIKDRRGYLSGHIVIDILGWVCTLTMAGRVLQITKTVLFLAKLKHHIVC